MEINKVQVSIIIVNYRVERELIACVSSILESKPKIEFEIVVVDNSSSDELRASLRKIPQAKYARSESNVGFGAGNNLGENIAGGEYLFFLNPDTLVKKGSIDNLYYFIKNNSKAGMVAPLLLDPSGKVYPNQGSDEYNLLSAIVILSFINKFFPNNPVSKKFLHTGWDKKNNEEFDVVPGTAFMISKELFKKVGTFDEKLFLYFEEYDLAKRIKKLGYKSYIVPNAKVLHIWEASAKKRKDINKIFSKSRFYFFKKHYGLIFASIINTVSNIGKYELLLSLILVVSAFLNLYKLEELMVFIGDQGWFYLSARDMLTSGQIPLVGIPSSHPWLHQGPLWTYLLAFFLWIFNFNPVSGAYASIILGALSVLGMYMIGSAFFSKRVGLIASLFYATSPLAVYYMRLPYHTSPIPSFVIILLFFLYKLINGKLNYLPFAILLLTILYNFEIATVALWGVLLVILMYRYLINKNNFKQIFNKKIIFFSFISLIVPLLPMILYDVRNGFPQTIKFAAWIAYRMISLFGYNPQQSFSISKIIIIVNFLFVNFVKLFFASNNLISSAIIIAVISWIIYIFIKGKSNNSYNLVFIMFFIPLLLVILNQVPSDAYLPMLFPITILLVTIFLDWIMDIKRMLIPILISIMFIVVSNINLMTKNNFSFESPNILTLTNRILVSKEILNMAGNKDYNLKGAGQGSEFESFTMNYEYLTWWLGHGPSKNNENIKIYVSESPKGIRIESRTLQ